MKAAGYSFEKKILLCFLIFKEVARAAKLKMREEFLA